MEEITLKELFEKYDDCSVDDHESYLIEELKTDVKNGLLSEEYKVYITLTSEDNLGAEGFLHSLGEMQLFFEAPRLDIPGKTYSVREGKDYYTLGFVYKK